MTKLKCVHKINVQVCKMRPAEQRGYTVASKQRIKSSPIAQLELVDFAVRLAQWSDYFQLRILMTFLEVKFE